MAEFVFNALRSPADTRDYLASANIASGPIPESVDMRHKLQPIRNQGSTDMCCAFAGCVIKEYPTNYTYFSPAYIYCQRPNAPQNGMYGRDMMSILLKKGVCPEEKFPFVFNKTNERATAQMLVKADAVASKYRIAKYYSIGGVDELKQALAINGPCLAIFPVFNTGSRFWHANAEQQPSQGGHAVSIVGYDKERGFLIRNSWGVMWGDMGYTWYPYSDWGSHWEIWAAEDLPSSPESPSVANCLFAWCF